MGPSEAQRTPAGSQGPLRFLTSVPNQRAGLLTITVGWWDFFLCFCFFQRNASSGLQTEALIQDLAFLLCCAGFMRTQVVTPGLLTGQQPGK